MSGVISDLGRRDTRVAELVLAVGNVVGLRVSLTSGTWVFSRFDSTTWWAAPLFVVHEAKQ